MKALVCRDQLELDGWNNGRADLGIEVLDIAIS